jgi:ubiquinone/menaquinone biosynthesis C-methylase UbiE
MREKGILRPITMEPYRVPFEDNQFDILISNEVFEHVQNYDATIRETHRLLKPGGIALHLFPARWIPIEPHVKVPLASVFRPKWWLYLWALLGRRNPHQKSLSAREVTTKNYDYLHACTNYLPAGAILAHFRAHFHDVRFVEDVFLRHATSPKARALYRMMRAFPPLRGVYSACWNRVLVATK